MQSVTENERSLTVVAVGEARDHIEADLHGELRALRGEIAQLRAQLSTTPTAPRAE
jgi:voltage-gated sodium channel